MVKIKEKLALNFLKTAFVKKKKKKRLFVSVMPQLKKAFAQSTITLLKPSLLTSNSQNANCSIVT